MNYGLERIAQLPLSLRLIREIHEKLMAGVRGGERTPGEFRPARTGSGHRDAHWRQRPSCRRPSTKCRSPSTTWRDSCTTRACPS
jgi:Fic family protein